MITIFDIEAEAIKLSDKIHQYLSDNRKDYNAVTWGYIAYDNGLFNVKIHDEYKESLPKTIQYTCTIQELKAQRQTKYFDNEDKELAVVDGKCLDKKGQEIDVMTLKTKTILYER